MYNKTSEEMLRQWYLEEKISVQKIAEKVGVSPPTIWVKLVEHGIPRRPQIANPRERKMTATREELYRMYWDERMSAGRIAEKYNVTDNAVLRWMEKYSIPRRGKYEVILKYPRKPFSGDENEKAYLIGLRAGDIHARKRATNTVGVNVTTTCPAMIELFEGTFGGYGCVKRYPARGQFGYEWYIYCDLDVSFKFLIEKSVNVPSDDSFYPFLAGYVDSEGTWTFSYQNGKPRPSFWIKSQDIQLLNGIKKRLENDGFHPCGPHLRVKGGTSTLRWIPQSGGTVMIKNTKDYFQLSLLRRDEMIRLIKNLMPFSHHKEKIERMHLVLKAAEGRLSREEVKNFIENSNGKIKECVAKAEIEYSRRHEENQFFV